MFSTFLIELNSLSLSRSCYRQQQAMMNGISNIQSNQNTIAKVTRMLWRYGLHFHPAVVIDEGLNPLATR